MKEHRNYRPLFILGLAGFLAAAGVVWFPQPPRREGRSSASFSIAIRTDRPGAAQLYYDLGGGFHERLSSRLDLQPGATLAEYTFALPAGNVEGLRFDPTDTEATVALARARIKGAHDETLLAFSPDDFVPSQQIAQLDRHGNELTARTETGGSDPALLLKLAAPLLLPGESSAETLAMEKRAARLQRGVAAALLVLGGVVAALFWRSVRNTSGAAPPHRGIELTIVAWAAFCVLYSRQPDVITHPQFWAEDGTIFFAQQHALGWKAALVTHGGYLHLLPRLTAGFASLITATAAPVIYLGVALLVVMLAILQATSPRVGLPYAHGCALAIVLAPNMDEIAFNLTNAQWFGAIVLMLIACSRPPATRGQLVGDVAAVVAFGLSGPFSVFFLPLFIVRAVRWPSRAVVATTLLLAITAALQTLAYWHSPAPPSLGVPFSWTHALAAAGYRTGGQLLGVMPPPLVTDPIAGGACGLVLWLLLGLAAPVARDFRATKILLFAGALLVLAGGLWRYRETVDVFFQRIHVQRYLHLPLVVTFWLLLAAVKNASGWKKAAFVGVGLLVLARNAPWYRVSPRFDYAWPQQAARLERGEPVEAPINPAGWTLRLDPPRSD